tara:strand:+ start:408 stop:644 length:237 start_codon:yes stop_codon:yes gene_type:complete
VRQDQAAPENTGLLVVALEVMDQGHLMLLPVADLVDHMLVVEEQQQSQILAQKIPVAVVVEVNGVQTLKVALVVLVLS